MNITMTKKTYKFCPFFTNFDVAEKLDDNKVNKKAGQNSLHSHAHNFGHKIRLTNLLNLMYGVRGFFGGGGYSVGLAAASVFA